MSENCRFCLRNLGYTDKFHEINDEIKSDFSDLTQHELIISDGHMNIVCELCLRSLQLASTLKKQLIENQEHFFNDFQYEPIDYEESASHKSDQAQLMFVNVDSDDIKQEKTSDTDEVVIQKSQKEKSSPTISKYKCSECGKKFSFPAQLEKHKETHSEMKIVCGTCGKGFKKIESLKLHMVYHGDPKYRCDICSTNFFEKSALNQHMRVDHLNKRDYSCIYCPKTYSKNCGLQRHILSMHKKQKFVCGVQSCLASFNYKHDCKAHIKKKHQDIKTESIDDYIIFSSTKSPQRNKSKY